MKKIYYILFLIIASHKIYSQAPTYRWAKVNHGEWEDYATGVATDLNNNVIEVGHFQSNNFNVQGQILTQSPDTNNFTNDYADAYIVKYDSNGNVLWRLKTIGLYAERILSVTTDKQGNIYAAGYYNDDFVKFGTITLNDPGNFYWKAFLMKLSPSGTVLWVKKEIATIGSFPNITANGFSITGISYTSIKTDNSGNIIASGKLFAEYATIGTSTLNNIPNLNSASGNLVFVKYDSNGNVVWAKTNTGGGFEESARIDVDINGNIYAIGSSTSRILAFGATSTIHPGDTIMPSPFVLKMDSNGNGLWLKRFGGIDASDFGKDIKVDNTGNIYVCGDYRSSQIVFAGTTLNNNLPFGPTARNPDLFIAKFNANGVEQWIKGASIITSGLSNTNSTETANAISVDINGCAYLSGTFNFPINLGGFTLNNSIPPTTSPRSDAFIAKYSDAGNVVWVKTFGGPGNDEPRKIDFDINDNLLMTGFFNGSSSGITFDTSTYIGHTGTNLFRNDAFLTKLNSSTGNCIAASNIKSEKANSISLFPNPNNGLFTIKTETPISEVKIMDVFNRIVFSDKYKSSFEIPIDLSKHANGLYLIEVILSKNKKEIMKLIKQ
jgi:Secretion system C-terminal sorting domain/Beta-propeller repeat